ncbi:MAG: F0F1 ATP synthase subunit alpha [Firmicutes bacterium]|nr:F0F1 ATP synthase subunit alpha [Candidatus Alectryobacillus merdavium]
MTDNLEALSGLIKKELENYEDKIDVGDVGTVVTIGDGIALIYGLKKVMMSELLLFPNDVYGMVMNLEENSVGCVLLGKDSLIHEGDIVKRTHKVVEVGVGDELLGRVINALGKPIDGLGEIKTTSTRPIEMPAPKIMDRESVNTPLLTGIKAIDSMIPIGKGQRELIIGDRQTGKTAIAIDTILNQKDKDVYCIYVAIGQKNSSIAQLVSKLEDYGAMKYTTIVCAGASESAPLLYIAPYAATSIAEYWMLQGKDVLIVYDDLSKHAVAYRTLSLLLKRSPGREAYPGDIFYIHSRLLERACHLKKELGGGSITALPIIETQAGDISAYIPTNVISITDGQIFLSSDLFNKGQRPAIDSGLSVSRVGSAAQYKSMKYVSASMKIELANYLELLEFSRFGSDLDKTTKDILNHGSILMEVLKQKQYMPLSLSQEIVDIYIAQNKLIDDIPVNKIHETLKRISEYIYSQKPEIYELLENNHLLDDDIKNKINECVLDVKKVII